MGLLSKVYHCIKPLILRACRGKGSLPPDAVTSRRLVILKNDVLGDMMLALGPIHTLLREHGEAACVLIVADPLRDLLRHLFPRATVLSLPVRKNVLQSVLISLWRHHRFFRRERFDALISLRYHRDEVHDIVFSHLRTKATYGCTARPNVRTIDGCHSVPYPLEAPEGTSLDLEAHRRLLSLFLKREIALHEITRFPPLPSTPSENVIIIAPFGSTEIRTYPLERFAAALKMISLQCDATFLLTASPSETSRLEVFRDLLLTTGVPRVEIGAFSSLIDLMRYTARCRGVLTVETGTAHLATLLDLPTLVLIGGGHYGLIGPWHRSPRQRWITHRMPCFHCNWCCIHPEPYCITHIQPEEIAAAFLELV